jgi:hypothetical protein
MSIPWETPVTVAFSMLPLTGLAVTVYSPPTIGNRPELPGSHRCFELVNPVVAQ